MMKVRVLFFGPARDFAPKDGVELDIPEGASVKDALQKLVEKFPTLKDPLARWRIAVNAEYADLTTALKDGDEMALIPPVSGGLVTKEADLVALTDQPIDLNALFSFVSSPKAGALVSFLGTVRDNNKGRGVDALTYEAYRPMAEKELRRLVWEMRERWSLCKVAIVHRFGTLSVGEISVAIVVSAPHRSDAFDAARYAIERLKEIVPIWKREHFTDGTTQWSSP